MNIFANSTEFGRDLTRNEEKIFTSIKNDGYAVFPKANLSQIKYLGPSGKYVNDKNSDLCTYYNCIEDTSILVYNATTYKFIDQLKDGGIAKIVCATPNITCITDTTYHATYNCIGWAVGITQWLNPRIITSHINKGLSPANAIDEFINGIKSTYPAGHLSRLDDFIDGLHSTKDNIHINNTVAFYFNSKNECLHGARYLHSINGVSLNKWTSKLGQSILISHGPHDLSGEHSMYGSVMHYADIKPMGDSNDEL